MTAAKPGQVSRTGKALFLDRDGVLIEYEPYLSQPEQVRIPEGAGMALRQWQEAGYRLFVVTNQSGIARGYFSIEMVEAVHQVMQQEYAQWGVTFTEIMICPHQPADACGCRKPSPQMVHDIADRYEIDLSSSYFIGDGVGDIECAQRSGCQPILLLTGLGQETGQTLKTKGVTVPAFSTLLETTQLLQRHSPVSAAAQS